MIFDPAALQKNEVYKLLSGAVIPRPIAWVSTVSKQGIRNLAPFSFFTVASWDPPTLCFCMGAGANEDPDKLKDTLSNIMETGEFVVNMVTLELANQMHKSGGNFPPEVDEFAETGLTPVESQVVSAPSVLEAPIHMECKLDRVIELGVTHMVLGRLVCYHIQDEYYLGNYKVDNQKLQPVGRMAGNYALVENFFELPNERIGMLAQSERK
jgi:flavin reductase (DIM6/NTAB) family NADH-FMN oxidoreductase RutF